jgi:hypothetical protein
MEEIEYPYQWTEEDTRTCDALVRSGHMTYREPVTVLGIVNAARAWERARICEILDRQPPEIRSSASATLVWLDSGAPELSDIGVTGGAG